VEKFLPHFVMVAWGCVFFGLLFLVNKLVSQEQKDAAFQTPFNVDQDKANPWSPVILSDYKLIILSALFFLGALILYPAAALFRRYVIEGYSGFVLIALLFFLGIFLIALVYVWIKGDLSWTYKRE